MTVNEIRKKLNNSVSDKNKLSSAEIEEQIKNRSFKGIDYEAADEEKRQIISHIPTDVNSKSNLQRAVEQRIKNEAAQKNSLSNNMSYEEKNKSLRNQEWKAYGKRLLTGLGYIASDENSRDIMYRDYQNARQQHKEIKAQHDELKQNKWNEKQKNNSKALSEDMALADLVKKAYEAKIQYNSSQETMNALPSYNNMNSAVNGLPSLADYKNVGSTTNEYEKAIKAVTEKGYTAEEAESLIDTYSRQINAEAQEKRTEKTENFANEHPVLASGAYVASNIGQLAGTKEVIQNGIQNSVSNLFGTGEYKPLDTNTYGFAATNFRDTISETVSDNIRNDVSSKTDSQLAANAATFLYQTGLSIGDFASLAGLGQPASLTIMGTSAAMSTAKDATERGASADKAMLSALWAGASEIVFEKLSLENLDALKASGRSGAKDIIKDILKQSFTEGSEEVFTDISNAIGDQIINSDKSELSQRYEELISDGLSESEAHKQLAIEFAKQIGESYLGGALSGSVMGAGGVAYGNIQADSNYRSVGNELKKSGNAQAEINAGLAQDNTSKAYQAAAQLQSKLDNSISYDNDMKPIDYSSLSSRKLGRLAEYNAQEDVRQLEKSAEVFEGDTAKSYVYAYGDNGYNGNVYDYNKGFNAVYMAQQQGKSINEAYDIALDEGSHITKLQAEIAYEAAKNDSENFSDIREIVYYSAKENNNSSIKQQLQNHSDELNNMDVVSKVDTSELSFNKKSMVREQAKSRFEKIYKQGGLLSNDGKFIEFTDKLVNGSLNYLKTPAEYAALFSIPDVIKNGKILDKHSEHKNRGYSTFTIMAPVEIDGIRGNAAAVIREVEGRNRYKVHRLLLPDGSNFVFDIKKDTEQGTYRPTSNDENLLTSSVSNNNVSYKTSVVNNHSMHYVEVDTSVKAKFDKAIHSEVKPGLTIIAKNITDDYRKAELKLIDNFAKDIDREVIIVDDTRLIGKDDANGFYEKGKIVLSLNADGGILLPYLGHELYHDLKVTSPIKAQKLEDFIIDFLKNSADYDYYARVDEIIELNDFKGTRQQQIAKANEEIAANACFTVLSERENFESLVKHDRSLAQKVRDFFADFIEKIKDSLDYIFLNTAEYKTLRDDPYAPEKILSMFNDCLKESQKNNTISNDSEIKYSKKLGKFADIDINSDNELNYYNIKNTANVLNDFVGVQKNVINTLKKDNFFNKNNRNIVVNADTDIIVEISPDGIAETLSKGKRYATLPRKVKNAKIATIRSLPDMIKYAEVIERKQENYYGNRDAVFLVLTHPALIDGILYNVEIKIKQSPKKNKFYIHNLSLKNEMNLANGKGTIKNSSTMPLNSDDSSHSNNVSQKYGNVKFSRKEKPYSYEALTSKPDMKITEIDDSKKYQANSQTRKDIINLSIENAKKIGIVNENGNAVIYVDDIDKNIIVPKGAIKHSLDRRLNVNAHISLEIGKILKKSICINEMIPRTDNIEKSYVLIGIAKNKANEPYVVSFVVNKITNEVSAIDVLYAVNAKKEPTGSPLTRRLSPQVSTPATGSTISISDLLDYVNKYYPDLLPEDVLKHYGYKGRPEGVLGESALYSLKESINVDDFSEEEYNYPKLGGREYKRLRTEFLRWHANHTNQIIEHRLDNGYKYVCILDDEYNLTVLGKYKSINIHKENKNVNRVGRSFIKQSDISGSKRERLRYSNIGVENTKTAGNNAELFGIDLQQERQSNRRGNAENDHYDYSREEKERYSIKGYKSALYIALKAVEKGDVETYQEYADKIYATDDAYDLLYSILVKYGYNSSQYRTAENRCVEIKKQNGVKKPNPKSSMQDRAIQDYAKEKSRKKEDGGSYDRTEPYREICIDLYGNMTKVNEALEKLND